MRFLTHSPKKNPGPLATAGAKDNRIFRDVIRTEFVGFLQA